MLLNLKISVHKCIMLYIYIIWYMYNVNLDRRAKNRCLSRFTFWTELEQQEYIKEQIDWSYIHFKDNQLCLNLLEVKDRLWLYVCIVRRHMHVQMQNCVFFYTIFFRSIHVCEGARACTFQKACACANLSGLFLISTMLFRAKKNYSKKTTVSDFPYRLNPCAL